MKRRDFFKRAGMAGAGMVLLPGFTRWGHAVTAAPGLSDPALQPKFVNYVPNALDPGFKFNANGSKGIISVSISETRQKTGLVDPRTGRSLSTRIWGYGDDRGPTWPGRTFEVQSGATETKVRWENQLGKKHLFPVDTNLHWAYSLPGYQQYSIEKNGVPIITHLHGGHTNYQFDGNPEFFYSPDAKIRGPQWNNVEGGFSKIFTYDNNVPAGNLWYHDHALGITRLNVYAGLAGFYFVRDDVDTGINGEGIGLPAFPYELAYAIQDRMFKDSGDLFYPAFPGDPFYDDFITGEGAILPPDLFPNGGPTALAEFFGDHMVVNGMIWPKTDVEPRNYRMRLLNGCDSRFMVLRFRAVNAGDTDFTNAGSPIPFYVIGSDQGLGTPAQTNTLVFEPGGRYDIVFNFDGLENKRIIMENIGGDAPFGGDFGGALEAEDLFPNRQTDRIMAFDVVLPINNNIADNFNPNAIGSYVGNMETVNKTREVTLFEGKDEFGRLQPLLGTRVNGVWKAIPWHSATTEMPELDDTEVWEIYNFTGDAHPVHLHLVNFEILGRNDISFDSDDGEPGQEVLQHNGALGVAPVITNVSVGGAVYLDEGDGYFEKAPKDMVTALPEQVTRVKATFDKPGRYVWHCHILSHEDHEMMRVLQVVPSAAKPIAADENAGTPNAYALDQNYPNPFNPSTQIRFQLPKAQRVTLEIFNIRGQKVRTLIDSRYSAGSHEVVWNGLNNRGRQVASGIYVYKIRAGNFTQTRKMNLIR